MKITQQHLDNLKPIIEKILSRKYEQEITVTHYTLEHNKEMIEQHEQTNTSSSLCESVHQRTS